MDALLHVEARLILESPVRSRRGSTSSGRSLHASASESSLLAARVAASSTSTRNAAMPPSHHLFQQQQRMLMKRSKLPPSGNAFPWPQNDEGGGDNDNSFGELPRVRGLSSSPSKQSIFQPTEVTGLIPHGLIFSPLTRTASSLGNSDLRARHRSQTVLSESLSLG